MVGEGGGDANPDVLPPVPGWRIMPVMDDADTGSFRRPPGRISRQVIEEELRRRLRDGTYPPGSRIPTQRTLVGEFGSSSVTLQRAIDRLVEFGLVEARGRLGTFVRAGGGEAAGGIGGGTVGLVFSDPPNVGAWNRFLGSVRRSGESLTLGRLRFRPYYMDQSRRDCEAARTLFADAAAGALDGIVFVFSPFYLDERLFSLRLPRVVIGGGGSPLDGRYRASLLRFEWDAIRERLLRGFAAAGRRRVAVMHAQGDHWDVPGLAAAVGLETRGEWQLPFVVDAGSAACARRVAHLLCSRQGTERPDCLLIEDDNLVPYATAGIVDAGLGVGAPTGGPPPPHTAADPAAITSPRRVRRRRPRGRRPRQLPGRHPGVLPLPALWPGCRPAHRACAGGDRPARRGRAAAHHNDRRAHGGARAVNRFQRASATVALPPATQMLSMRSS